MLTVKFLFIFYSVFNTPLSSSNFQDHKNVDRFTSVSDNTIEIINTCYSRETVDIILSGEIDNKIAQSFHQLNKSVIIINRLEDNQVLLCNHPGLFIIVTSSTQNLDNYLINIRSFPKWNIYQPFFILDSLTYEDECRNAPDFLQILWRYNLLNAFFLCYQNESTFIWTLNPFVSIAPDPWRYFKFTEDSLVEWTLHYQPYQSLSNTNICIRLLWDKTEQTNGFEVKAAVPLMSSLMYNSSCSIVFDSMVQSEVLKMLNVSIKKTCIREKKFFTPHSEGKPFGLVKLASGSYDIVTMILYGRHINNVTVTNFNTMAYLRYFVLKKESISASFKILHYLGSELIIATVIITTVTMLVLRYFMKQSVGSLVLEIIRLLANAGVLKLPSTVGLKFFFFPVFCFFLLLQGIFQGKLSTLLTISLPEKNLETLDDLRVHSDYKIYVARSFSNYLDEGFKNRSTLVSNIFCGNELQDDKKAVCVTNFNLYLEMAASDKFDLSTESFYSSPFYTYTRKDWPLQRKFDKYQMVLTENGYVHKWEKKWNYTLLKPRKSFTELIDEAGYSILKVMDLSFAFYGLVIGHCLGMIVFLIEIKSWKIFKKLVCFCRNFIRT